MTLVPISSNQGQMLFTWRVVKHWNRLLRETVKSPSLEIFAAQLGVRLSKLMKRGCCTAVSRAEAMRDPFLPRLLHQCIISMPVQFVLIQSPFFFFFPHFSIFTFRRTDKRTESEGNTTCTSHGHCVSNISFSLCLSTKVLFLLFLPETT